jgi:EmrB/QacA subfamily drug resistance transporter
MVQATGGSMLTPVALSIIRNVFADPRERAQAIGFWGATFGASMALGPLLGGIIVAALDWRGVFWINLPVGLVALVLTRRIVPESRAPNPRRIDPAGQLLVIATLAPLTFAIIEGPSLGWLSAGIVAAFAGAGAAAVALVLCERRQREPMLDLRFFRSIPFSGASVIAIAVFAALGGYLLLNTLYLQEVRGYSALVAGVCTLPLAAMVILLPPLSGRLVGRGRSRLALVIGGTGMAAGAALLTGLRETTPLPLLLLAYAVFGIGLGVVNVPISNTAVAGMPPAQAGVAASIASTARQVGTTLGVAVIGATANTAVGGAVSRQFAAATHTGWWIIVGCGIAVLVFGLLTTTARATASAERATAGFGSAADSGLGASMRPLEAPAVR